MSFFDSDSTSERDTVEIRKGRRIFCRKIVIGGNRNGGGEQRIDAKVLFVHGSCAASSQYDDLVAAMGRRLGDDGGARPLFPYSFRCYLYDQLGCGASASTHPVDDWSAYATTELNADLSRVVSLLLDADEDDGAPLFVVGHSHGCSQIVRVLNELAAATNGGRRQQRRRAKGVVLVGGGLLDGPADDGTIRNGGHWIFRWTPTFFLRLAQPSLSETFFRAAVHPDHRERLRRDVATVSNRNDMAFCKAFYRQQTYVASNEAARLEVSTLVVHGSEDGVVSLASGEHLHRSLKQSSEEMIVVPRCSHQVFQEKPDEVAEAILSFVRKRLEDSD